MKNTRLHPFQCVATIQPIDSASSFFLAACGPRLCSVCLDTGEIVSGWAAANPPEQQSATVATEGDVARPVKKHKANPSDSAAGNSIIKLAISPKQDHVLVVTEDKHVRVFSFSTTGKLSELSSRCMPKRPCAIQVMSDNATILCGDKFGDVYSLPLLPDPDWAPPKAIVDGDDLSTANEDKATHFIPSATDKTVHTARNLKTLAAQQSQKSTSSKTKNPLDFEHELLLGHVSVLTDLEYTSMVVDGKRRGYIVTADRDEHIRFSRAPPQSHIIEGYCLGHTEFVSKICLVPNTNILVSGGGDSWLGLWNWPEFQLLRKLPIDHIFGEQSAVSFIKVFSCDEGDFLLVGCEARTCIGLTPVAALNTSTGASSDLWSVVEFGRPVLDVAFHGNIALVSLYAEATEDRIVAYNMTAATSTNWTLVPDSLAKERLIRLNATPTEADRDLVDLLYGYEKLRKRDYHEEGLADD